MRAEILAVGSELLMPGRVETNASTITARLRELGITVAARVTVADEPRLLEDTFRNALSRADVVISTGGLGPTADDLTREAAAGALGRPLRRDPEILEALRARFAKFGRVMAPVNEQQADVIEGARVLPNPRGTAAGQWVEDGGRVVVLLPGPPHEMIPMLEQHVLPHLAARAGGRVLRTRVLRIASMGESDVEQLVAPIYRTFTNPATTILSSPGLVELHLTAEGADEAEALGLVESLAAPVRLALEGHVFSEDGRDLQEVVAGLLVDERLTLAVAESCTAGMLTSRLASVPGASAFLLQGWTTYSNESKIRQLDVSRELIETHGAVSGEGAAARAAGARRVAGADVAVAITGVAGPTGGTEEKPVGLVFIALAGALGDRVVRRHFFGERDRVRWQSAQLALELLRRALVAPARA
jgi:nicotinamide-nucleotide amidase